MARQRLKCRIALLWTRIGRLQELFHTWQRRQRCALQRRQPLLRLEQLEDRTNPSVTAFGNEFLIHSYIHASQLIGANGPPVAGQVADIHPTHDSLVVSLSNKDAPSRWSVSETVTVTLTDSRGISLTPGPSSDPGPSGQLAVSLSLSHPQTDRVAGTTESLTVGATGTGSSSPPSPHLAVSLSVSSGIVANGQEGNGAAVALARLMAFPPGLSSPFTGGGGSGYVSSTSATRNADLGALFLPELATKAEVPAASSTGAIALALSTPGSLMIPAVAAVSARPQPVARSLAPLRPDLLLKYVEAPDTMSEPAAQSEQPGDGAFLSGALPSVGHVLFSDPSRAWLLTLLAVGPLLWKLLDPLEVLFAWEAEKKQRGPEGTSEEETLLSLVS